MESGDLFFLLHFACIVLFTHQPRYYSNSKAYFLGLWRPRDSRDLFRGAFVTTSSGLSTAYWEEWDVKAF